ncbi:hypothetical protein ACFPYI_22030 [Halomarina salina]|uniref:Lipoprotein n=1 Tax=Halomarina salina TaxID=1872699 RepID=A0ABD5RU98_9EURY|nr:hypothetical protein [Halomarina salina]
MRRALPLAVVALVCLAGCGGLVGDGSSPASTSTPADVPTDSPLVNPPPGLSEDGVTGVQTLVDAHTDALDNRSFTERRSDRLLAANGTTLAATNSTGRVNDAHDRAATSYRLTGIPASSERYVPWFDQSVTRLDQWYNGSQFVLRGDGPNGTMYASVPPLGTPTWGPTTALERFYYAAESTRVSSENGSIEVQLDGVTGNWSIARVSVTVTDGTVTVTMTDDGRVTQYRTEFTGTLERAPNTTVEGEQVVEYTAVGETTVDRPEWVDSARNATTTIN